MRNFFLGFLIVFFVSCGFLFWRLGQRVADETRDFVPDNSIILEAKINNLVKGHPIEKMSAYISKKNSDTASFLVAIAKKESNWGVYSPHKLGRDCYNYWGYRGKYNKTASGYSCFDSPSQAVAVVGGRIDDLIAQRVDTPKEMVTVWKCGYDCSWDNPASVRKWTKDVSFYFEKLN
jgi:hypothetical protein